MKVKVTKVRGLVNWERREGGVRRWVLTESEEGNQLVFSYIYLVTETNRQTGRQLRKHSCPPHSKGEEGKNKREKRVKERGRMRRKGRQ